jgi:uncharacterized protein
MPPVSSLGVRQRAAQALAGDLRGLRDGARDPVLWVLAALGLAAWLLPRPAFSLGAGLLLLKALAEEAAFRFGVQESIARRWPARRGPLSGANLAASALFALAHLAAHPPLWAAAAFFPSLAFGLAWERRRSLALCALLHFWYNWLLFARP